MNNAKLYQKTNSVQRRDAKKIIEEFSALFDQRKNAKLLDVGCGSGDVLVEILFPYLENSFDQVVGSDISQEMVKHAWDKYRNKSKHLKFQRMDIESDFLSSKSLLQGNEEWKKETFDIITSFYCLHWIQDQR
jgi:juvenile hormone-III synthase